MIQTEESGLTLDQELQVAVIRNNSSNLSEGELLELLVFVTTEYLKLYNRVRQRMLMDVGL
jgi:hypothetical protein